MTVYIVNFLAKNNIPAISGMAKEIDGYAYSQCISSNGFTVAVLGCGLDICYPKEHNFLMSKITEKRCVISEYTLRRESFEKGNILQYDKFILVM